MASHAPHEHHPTPRPLAKIRTLVHLERGDITVVVIYAIFIAILSLATPIAVEAMVTTVIFGVVLWPIIWLAIILLACLALAGTIRLVEMWVIEVLQRRLFVRTVTAFAQRLPATTMDTYESQSGPTLVNRFFDVVTVQKSVSALLLDGVGLLLSIIVGMIVLAVYHPLLLAFDFGLIVALLIVLWAGRGGVGTGIAESHAKYDVAGWLEEIARIPQTFKTGYGPMLAFQRADELTQHWVENRRAHYRVVFRQYFLAVIVQIVANVLLLGLGGWLVIQRQLTIGQLVAAELIISFVVGSLLKLNKYLDNWYDLCSAIEKVSIVNELPQERANGMPLPVQPQGMRIAVNDVQFQLRRTLLHGQSWAVEPNEKVGLTGKGGSGKSVLLDVLAGFREPTAGNIVLDGFDLRELELNSLRQQVQIVRDVQLFAGTILDNLCLGRPNPDPHEIREALQAVNLLPLIQSLPDGLETLLTPTGRPLSSSESLRLCLARAILSQPRLLILDGVLDVLDMSESPELLDTLFAPMAPFTLLVASSDAEVLRRCQRVVGLGTPSDLLN